jgi:hypothetical protein
MFGSLMLDETGDLIEAVETIATVDYTTIAVAVGSQQVSQSMSLRVSTKTKDVWFNEAAGIDFDDLFYNSNQSDTIMNPIRAQAFRETLEATPGFGDYAENKDVVFTRTGRKLEINLPCTIIDCDSSRFVPAVIG